MAIDFRAELIGTDGTSLDGSYSPEVGSAFSGFLYGNPVFNSNGVRGGASAFIDASADFRVGGSDDFTLDLTISTTGAGEYVQVGFRSSIAGFSGNYYYVELGASGMSLWRNTTQQGSTITAGITTNTTYTLKIVAVGARFRVYFNGSTTASFDYTDGSPFNSGMMALYLLGTARVDRIEVNDVATVPGASGAVIESSATFSLTATSELAEPIPPLVSPPWTESRLVGMHAFDRLPFDAEAVPGGGGSAVIESAATFSLTAGSAIGVLKAVASAHAIAVTTASAVGVAKPVASDATASVTTASDVSVTVSGLASASTMSVTTASAVTVTKGVDSAATMSVTTASAVGVVKAVQSASTVSLTTASAVTVPKPISSAATASVTTASAVGVAKPVASAATASVTAGAAVGVAKPVSSAATATLTTDSALAGGAATVTSAATVVLTATGTVSVLKPVASASALALSAGSSVVVPKGVQSAATATLTAASQVGVIKHVASGALIVVTATSVITIGLPPIAGLYWVDVRAAVRMHASTRAAVRIAADAHAAVSYVSTVRTAVAMRADQGTASSAVVDHSTRDIS